MLNGPKGVECINASYLGTTLDKLYLIKMFFAVPFSLCLALLASLATVTLNRPILPAVTAGQLNEGLLKYLQLTRKRISISA